MTDYAALITPEHDDKPLFVAFVGLVCSGAVDGQAALRGMPAAFDFEAAAGARLDSAGLWIGLPRTQFVPGVGTIVLGDGDYRVLLRAKILGNHWDGGMETYQAILASIFPGGITLFAVDNQDMTIDVYITGGTPTPLQLALLKGGLLVPKPEGVRIRFVLVGAGPQFGLDQQDSRVAGLDSGAFVEYL